jgi:hypothetical protein
MMRTLILAGPWSRCIKKSEAEYIEYVRQIRNSIIGIRIIFSSTDPVNTIPIGIFDIILSNKIPNNTEYNINSQNYTSRLYALNSYKAVEFCKGHSIIRLRSDLLVKNFDLLLNAFELIEKSDKLLLLDFTEQHNNVLPFNYSDFFVAGSYDNLLLLFAFSPQRVLISKISFQPFTSHTMGRTRNFITNEQFLWFNYFNHDNSINKLDTLKGFYYSSKYLHFNLKVINRELLFHFDEKLNAYDSDSKFDFSVPSSLTKFFIVKLLFIGTLRYYLSSIHRLASKVFF